MSFLSIEPLLEDVGQLNLRKIDWVIVGGESGAGARPMKQEWVVNIQKQCASAKVPFFFKQWGGVRKSKAGRELNGHTYDDLPPIVRTNVADATRRKTLIAELQFTWPAYRRVPVRQTA